MSVSPSLDSFVLVPIDDPDKIASSFVMIPLKRERSPEPDPCTEIKKKTESSWQKFLVAVAEMAAGAILLACGTLLALNSSTTPLVNTAVAVALLMAGLLLFKHCYQKLYNKDGVIATFAMVKVPSLPLTTTEESDPFIKGDISLPQSAVSDQ